jgi:hypothetical protein
MKETMKMTGGTTRKMLVSIAVAVVFLAIAATRAALAAEEGQPAQGILDDNGVANAFETYDGNHTNHITERFVTKVLPFFSKELSFPSGK